MRLLYALLPAAVLFLASAASAQKARFRSITIEENTSGAQSFAIGGAPPLLARNVPLRRLVMYAYGIDEAAALAGPDWIDATRYDIKASLKDPLARYDLREELRRLLEDRFKLATHLDIVPRDVYLLSVAEGGPKIQPFKPEPGKPVIVPRGAMSGPIRGLAMRLSIWLRQPVLDETGLIGMYVIALQVPAEYRAAVANQAEPLSDEARAAIVSAVQAQLGLNLAAAKVPGQTRVIDHIERPAGTKGN